jgi:hypothetical protein
MLDHVLNEIVCALLQGVVAEAAEVFFDLLGSQGYLDQVP